MYFYVILPSFSFLLSSSYTEQRMTSEGKGQTSEKEEEEEEGEEGEEGRKMKYAESITIPTRK